MHIVVFLPRWVGDIIMSTPMLRAMRRHFGDRARITGVMRPSAAGLLEGTAWLDRMMFYDRGSRDPSHRFAAVVRQLRADPADIALIVPNSLSSAALAFAGGAKRRVGMAMDGRRLLLTDPVRPLRVGRRIEPFSSAAYPVELAMRIGVPPEPLRLELVSTAADEALANAVLARLFPDSDPDGPLVVFNDNSASGTAKAWGGDKFAALARRTIDLMPDARVLVHCGPDDRREARAIAQTVAHPAVQSLGDEARLPFGLSKAVIRRARVVVSTDSGPRHIAAAFQRPTVVLLGPMDPRLSRAEHDRLAEMRLDLPCSPCGESHCPLKHHDCMRLLAVEDVLAKMLELLESKP